MHKIKSHVMVAALVLVAGAVYATRDAHAIDWKEHPNDKISHVVIGGAISCGITHYTKKPLLGMIAATLIGLVKESAVDDNFNRADLASWGVGGAVGALCIKF